MNHISQKLDNDQLFMVLKKIIKERSNEVLQDAQLFDSLMKDLLPEITKETYLLTCSIKENIAMEIQKLGSKSQIEPDFTILMNRLVDKYCIQTEYAEWVIKLWDSVFTKNNEESAKNQNVDQREVPIAVKTGKTDLNTQEIESILKKEIKSLTEKIYTIDLERNITRKFLVKYCGVTIFLIIIQLISIPFSVLGVFLGRFFGEGFFIAIIAVPIIIGGLSFITNIILLSIIIPYRNKATKLE